MSFGWRDIRLNVRLSVAVALTVILLLPKKESWTRPPPLGFVESEVQTNLLQDMQHVDPHMGHQFSLYGPSQSGKTTTALWIAQQLSSQTTVVYVDLNQSNWTRDLYKQMVQHRCVSTWNTRDTGEEEEELESCWSSLPKPVWMMVDHVSTGNPSSSFDPADSVRLDASFVSRLLRWSQRYGLHLLLVSLHPLDMDGSLHFLTHLPTFRSYPHTYVPHALLVTHLQQQFPEFRSTQVASIVETTGGHWSDLHSILPSLQVTALEAEQRMDAWLQQQAQFVHHTIDRLAFEYGYPTIEIWWALHHLCTEPCNCTCVSFVSSGQEAKGLYDPSCSSSSCRSFRVLLERLNAHFSSLEDRGQRFHQVMQHLTLDLSRPVTRYILLHMHPPFPPRASWTSQLSILTCFFACILLCWCF